MAGSATPLQLPRHRELHLLGRGGYSEVYRAYQEQFDRWVAVKVLTFALTEDRARRRFLRECQVAGRLSTHPNIVTVYDAGLTPDGRPYISMELYERGSVADALRADGPQAVADALRVAIAVAGALETAHRAGVVHRDVKPANVLLAGYGPAALTDFGLSVVTERQEVSTGVDALTPYHAPPEVLERTTVTPVADVWSLASTTYAMLAGRAPHQREEADSLASLLLRILQADIPPLARPDVPPLLGAVLRHALTRDPKARTPSALAFAEGLQDVQRELGLEVTEPVIIPASGGGDETPVPSSATGTGAGAQPGSWRLDVTAPEGSGRDETVNRAHLRGSGPVGQPPVSAVWAPPAGDRRSAFAPVPSFGDAPPPGESTVHRSLVRAPAPPPLAREAPARRRRAPLIVAGVAALVVVGGVTAVLVRDSDGGRGSGGSGGSTTTTSAAAGVAAPTGLEAAESEAGVQLDWDDSGSSGYVVLVMSGAEPPRVLPAVDSPSVLVPAAALRPDDGYCFAVATVEGIAATPADQAAAAFGPPICIRGASEGTVRTS